MMESGSVGAACASAGMKPVCGGALDCRENSKECVLTPLSTNNECGFTSLWEEISFYLVNIISSHLFRFRLGWVLSCCNDGPLSRYTPVPTCPNARKFLNGTHVGWHQQCYHMDRLYSDNAVKCSPPAQNHWECGRPTGYCPCKHRDFGIVDGQLGTVGGGPHWFDHTLTSGDVG